MRGQGGFLLADLLLGAAAVTFGALALFRVVASSSRAVARGRETAVAAAVLEETVNGERIAALAGTSTCPMPGQPVTCTRVVAANGLDYRCDIRKEVVSPCDGLELWTCAVRRDGSPPPRSTALVSFHTGVWRP